jgi:hypothetical protein
MAEFKKQHYLPASYLKYFTDDATKRNRNSSVWRLDATTQRRVPVASQCHSDYFYSKTKAKEAESTFHPREEVYCKIVDEVSAGKELEVKRMGDLFLCMFDLHLRNAIHENRTKEEGFEAYGHRLNMFLFQMLISGDGKACSIEQIKQHITNNWVGVNLFL